MRWAILIPFLTLGCFGGSQNPSYFPYLTPSGDIIRTHAKPPGLGYFKNYDPKACKIELAPASAMNATRTQVVLVASVVDKDGDARRKRRVEWQLEGPGQIVEVDESGYLPGRGYQITDKFAVSYTDLLTHTITRGNDDPRDDFTICAGQTWCVVSSPVEGQTIVTAYAPEVHDWENRRAFAKLIWTDGGFAPVRSGRETDSTLNDRAKAEVPAGPALVLDAKLAKAIAVNREATATITLANSGRTTSNPATVRAAIPDGMDLVRTEPAATRRSGRDLYWTLDGIAGGQSREIAMVLRPTRSGAITLAAAADTTDGLTATTKAETVAGNAGMNVSVNAPAFSAAGEKATVAIMVSNTGGVPIENAVAWVTPASGLTAGGTVPMEVAIGSIAAGQSRTVDAVLNAERTGKSNVRVDVTADGGLSARGEGTVTVGKAELMVRVVGPEVVPVGDTATYEVQVANAGDVGASDVKVNATLPRGLTTGNETQWKIPTLAPGEKKVFRLTASGERLSELTSVTAAASGTLANGGRMPDAKTSAPVTVRGLPVLVLEVQAPSGPVSVGSKATYRVVVRNRGNAPARDVIVSAELSRELRGAKGDSRIVFDRVSEIAAGASSTFIIDAEAVTAGDARVNVDVQSKDLPTPLKEEQATRITSRK